MQATSSLSRKLCINLPRCFLCSRPLQYDAVHNSFGPAFPFLSLRLSFVSIRLYVAPTTMQALYLLVRCIICVAVIFLRSPFPVSRRHSSYTLQHTCPLIPNTIPSPMDRNVTSYDLHYHMIPRLQCVRRRVENKQVMRGVRGPSE